MTDRISSGIHRLESALTREKRLTEASYLLHTTLDLDELLGLILAAAREGVEADRGTVYVLSTDGTEIWSKVTSGDESLEIRLPLGQGISGTVAETGETIRIDDAYADERFDRSWDETSGYRTRQILCRPITSREGKIAGVFQLLNKREGNFDEGDEQYLDSLSIHAALALENATLHLSAVERERQDREIRLVQEVQRVYQPERSVLDLGGMRAAGLNLLCEDASGDYYDFIELADGRQVVVIGDVSGHGLKAALVMAQARAFLRAFCTSVDSLPTIMDRLDACLARDLSGGSFMCMFVGVVDPKSGHMVWSNAGHPPPLLRRARDGSVERLLPTGRILGILPDPSHAVGEAVTLEPGDTLLLYTDGATEANRSDGEMFTEERLTTVLDASADKEPADVLEAVRDALYVWTGEEHMEDDLTLVAVKMVGDGPEATPV